ncbi:ribonuclease H-like YkuK family protein [Peribacillus sp. SCS-37]|uniref:ribonuclease H-like YkuK family protein n=1 Tax=Paraperibacillus esterisolvens TaxID=3115296 RepID=UPI003905F814
MEQEQVNTYHFHNLSESNMTFEQVFQRIVEFIQKEPHGNYRLIVGTDSQVHKRNTVFITAIIIHRQGKGAWMCSRKEIIPRKMLHLHERISKETSLTEQLAALFTEKHRDVLINLVLPHIYNGAGFTIEGHIDIGNGSRNKTREFVREMVARIEAMGLQPVIKPNSYGASSVANKYTKRNALGPHRKIV